MPEATLPEVQTLKISEIKPYADNARKIPESAIEAVKDSIVRYGYVQPIVVDAENVIVVGHTRYEALKRLGAREIDVYVTRLSEDKVREYRLADNRTGELTSWDQQALVLELREFEKAVVSRFFPDVDLEVAQARAATAVTQAELDAAESVTAPRETAPVATVDVQCPACRGSFKVRADSLPD
jgi:hypothetical protein